MNEACQRATQALATGEPVDSAHLAACPACRERETLVQRLTPREAPSLHLVPPTVSGLRARWRRRVATRASIALAAGILVAVALRPEPEPVDVDLLAVFDDADQAVEPVETLDEDLLALLEPGDPSAAADPLVDALMGEGSL